MGDRGRADDDQRGLRWAGHEDAGLGRRARARAHQVQQRAGDQRLQQQDPRGCQQNGHDVGDNPCQIERHAGGDEKHPQRQPLERGGHRLDLVVILGLGDEQAGDHRADHW